MAEPKCPACGKKTELADNHEFLDTNIKTWGCLDEDCDYEFCLDQSVKIPGKLVHYLSRAIAIHGGYTSLAEFIRAAARARAESIIPLDEYYSRMMEAILGFDPEEEGED